MKFDRELIRDLVKVMEEHQVRRLYLKNKEEEIEIETGGVVSYAPAPAAAPPALAVHHAPIASKDVAITSPFVGTYYSSPSPQDPVFIKEGDQVDEESVVCIVEAMKVMNEVKAGTRGRVTKILLKNGDPVEFGTEILRIEPV